MKIGVLKEIKDGECRAALTPGNVHTLRTEGHGVLVQTGAGALSGFSDAEYKRAGARLTPSAKQIWRGCDLIVKVKEPLKSEIPFLPKDKILFCYLHLAANAALTQALMKAGTAAVASETVQDHAGRMPLLEPMSEIAGRMAVIVGSFYQATPQGGWGVLVSGLPGVLPAHVVILGGGTVGENAAKIASGMGAQVTILDKKQERMRVLDEILPENVSTLISTPENIESALSGADIIIGAVLIPGAKAPKLITKKMIGNIRRRSVLVDVSIDQGGISETSRATSHSRPTYYVGNVLHYCVPNMPGAYGRSATIALSNALTPYISKLARQGLTAALKEDPGLAAGLNVYKGKLVCREVADSLRLPCADWKTL